MPVAVSVIGGAATAEDAGRTARSPAARLLLAATAQGLVRFDGNGGIEPGLAERWIVIDDGRSVIFRLREAEWPDGRRVTAADVVASLRRRLARDARNPLMPYLSAIDEVVAMTPQVVEVRLSKPRPDLLKLFAQPELALLDPRGSGGSGPFSVERDGAGGILLRPVADPSRSPDDRPDSLAPEDHVRLRGERAAVAILRFAAKRSDLVEGGTLADWPLVDFAEVPPANIRIDAAAGVAGFQFAHREGLLADPGDRAAIAMALDPVALTAAVSDGWAAAATLLPDQLDSARPPATVAWAAIAPADREATARARLVARHGATAATRIRVALPEGTGGTALWGAVAAPLVRIGLAPERVAPRAPAELRFVDAVAPYDSARWYLRTACQPCGAPVAALITAARDAPDLATRATRLADADAALAADIAFVPIARPLRWSLVAGRLRAWTPNARGFHPLNHLRAAPK